MMKSRSVFEGVYVVAKFFLSKSPEGSMNCISRTLGKFSIVDKNYDGEVGNKEVWICKIVKEIQPQKNSGAFILRPIEKIDGMKVRKIIPGFYEVQTTGRAALVMPNTNPEDYWILSKTTRQIFSKKYYAVIVPIAYSENKAEEIVEKAEPQTKLEFEIPITLAVGVG